MSSAASPRVSEVEMWTVQQVFEYFKQLSLHDVAQVVQSQGVDGKTLMNMSSSGFQAFPENKRKLIRFIMKNIKSEKNATITIMKAVLQNLQGISVKTPSPDEDYYIYFEDPTSKVDDKDSKCTLNHLSDKEDMQNNQYEGFSDSYIQPDACKPMESIERPHYAPLLHPKPQFTPPELSPRPGTQNNLSDKEDMQNNQYEGFSDPYVQPDACKPMESIEQPQCASPLHPKRQSTPPEPPPRPRFYIPLTSVHQRYTKPQVQTVSCTALASCGLNMAMNPMHRSQAI
uniref:SAM domain-containing protein n=1 Tax=Eptatretus burgeri TaxID=7764 RepID=A0A8C4QTD4_EPTBU